MKNSREFRGQWKQELEEKNLGKTSAGSAIEEGMLGKNMPHGLTILNIAQMAWWGIIFTLSKDI